MSNTTKRKGRQVIGGFDRYVAKRMESPAFAQEFQRTKADLDAVEAYKDALKTIEALDIEAHPVINKEQQSSGMWCDGPCGDIARNVLDGYVEDTEQMICKDCKNEMLLVTCNDNPITGYAYNVYECLDCMILCKQDVWNNTGCLWIDMNNKINIIKVYT